jgi:hypothetical protein
MLRVADEKGQKGSNFEIINLAEKMTIIDE